MKIRIQKNPNEWALLDFKGEDLFEVTLYDGNPENTISSGEIPWSSIIEGMQFHGYIISDGYLESLQ